MVESQTHNWKVTSSSLGPAGIVGGESECTALSPPLIPWWGALEQGTEPRSAPRVPQHKMAAHYSGCVCALLMGKCRTRIQSMNSPYLALCHVTIGHFLLNMQYLSYV